MTTKGIILAGGEGKRLQPLGLGVPKPLVAINEKPLINHNLELFARYGVNDVAVIIRPADRTVFTAWKEKYEGAFPDVRITLMEEPIPMGTLGYFFHHMKEWMDGQDVFVTNGDDIKDIDLAEMAQAHRRLGAPATIALMKMERPDDYGVVLVSADYVTNFLEKEPGLPPGLVSAGMYLISPAAFTHMAQGLPADEKFLMFEKHMFPVLAAKGKLAAFVAQGSFYDCGTPERLTKAIREV